MINKSFVRNFFATVLAVGAFAATGAAQSLSYSPVSKWGSGTVIDGAWSTLVRSKDGVRGTVVTSDLAPGSVQSIWYVVFNKPENCATSPCGVPDLGNPAAGPGMIGRQGQIAGPNGASAFAAELKVGDPTGVFRGMTLMDAEKAEIHIVLRYHGQPMEGVLEEQLRTFGDGCPAEGCANVQFAIFMAGGDVMNAKVDAIQDLLGRVAQRMSINP